MICLLSNCMFDKARCMEELTHLTFSGNVFQKMMLVQQVSFFVLVPL